MDVGHKKRYRERSRKRPHRTGKRGDGAGVAYAGKRTGSGSRITKNTRKRCRRFLVRETCLQIGVLIGSRLRSAVQTIGITDPVGAIQIYSAPLVTPLIFVYMFIGDAQYIQAKTGSAGTAGAGCHMIHQIAVGIVIVGCIGRIDH